MFRAFSRLGALALVVLFSFSLVPAAPAFAVPSVASPVVPAALVRQDNSKEIIAVFDAINAYRKANGVPAVRYNAKVSRMSQEWVAAMASRQAIEHNPGFLNDSRAVGWNAAGEVIAVRWDRKAAALVDWWKSSPSHKAVLLDKRMTVVGLGISFTNATNNYSMAGLANFFGFTKAPAETYATPKDYFGLAGTAKDPITVKYSSAGGLKALGAATGKQVTGLAAGGRVQEYEKATISWSPAAGAAITGGAIRALWRFNWAQDGYLGYPVSDEAAGRGGSLQVYERGRLAWTPEGGAVNLSGAIGPAWASSGGPSSALRYPIQNERSVPGGAVQNFQGGQFFWSPSTGAHFVFGGIKGTWEQMGGSQGYLGFPLTNEQYGFRSGGAVQEFMRGAVTWSPSTNTHVVIGGIFGTWKANGGAAGRLGFPVTGEYPIKGGAAQRFEAGTITWTSAGPKVVYS